MWGLHRPHAHKVIPDLLIFYLFIYNIYFYFSLVAASGGFSSLQGTGFSLQWFLLLWSTGSVVVAHRLRGSPASGIFPDQGSNWCPLSCKTDSYPLDHQGSPLWSILKGKSAHLEGCSFPCISAIQWLLILPYFRIKGGMLLYLLPFSTPFANLTLSSSL